MSPTASSPVSHAVNPFLRVQVCVRVTQVLSINNNSHLDSDLLLRSTMSPCWLEDGESIKSRLPSSAPQWAPSSRRTPASSPSLARLSPRRGGHRDPILACHRPVGFMMAISPLHHAFVNGTESNTEHIFWHICWRYCTRRTTALAAAPPVLTEAHYRPARQKRRRRRTHTQTRKNSRFLLLFSLPFFLNAKQPSRLDVTVWL